MNNIPNVSVIIPMCNGAEAIRQSVDWLEHWKYKSKITGPDAVNSDLLEAAWRILIWSGEE